MKLKAPNVFVLMSSILVLVGALTWILPGGEFERVEKDIPNYGTKLVVVPGSYRPVEAVRQGPADILMAPMYGFHDHQRDNPRDGSAVIGFILLIGGAFGVLQKTGALMAGLGWITLRAKGAGRLAMIPLLMFMFSAGGALFGMAEESIVFVMITVPLAVALRFDVITGIAIPFVGSQAGFATAFVNPFTLGIAKGITGQEMGVGYEYRLLCWFLVTTLCSAFVLWHALRVSRDPSKSLTPELDREWRDSFEASSDSSLELTRTHVRVLLCFLASMVLLGVGAVQFGWYIPELAALFLGMALVCGLVGRLSLGDIADSFMDGAKTLCGTAILVAFARAIMIVADDGKIVDTILYGLSQAMDGFGPLWGTECMFAVQTGINFFVPSGSGQAALTMPVMSPLAEILEIHQENAILAYQFGDGFSNMIIPTNPVLIGVISVARLSYGTWFRWMIKYQLLLFLVGMILLAFSPFHTA